MNAPTTPTPDLEKPRETFRRLHAIANNAGATDAERETARGVMARYIAKYGSEVQIPEEEPHIERMVTFDGPHDRMLLNHCALFMGAKTYAIGKRVYAGTKRGAFRDDGKTFSVEGPESAVLAALELFAHHRVMLKRLLDLVENGYRFGAMPLPDSVRSEKAEPMSPEMFRALKAASAAGAANAASKRLGNGGA